MSTTTTNFGLTKPDATDNVDVSVINTNYDLIDTKAALKANSSGGGELGTSASATTGGAIGASATSSYNGGFAGGQNAREAYGGGGAVGYGANSTYGAFAGGWNAIGGGGGNGGGAVGSSSYAAAGGAVGAGASTSNGAAVGFNAKCLSGSTKIDAVQLGTGTNSTAYSMQVYTTPLLIPVTAGTANDGLVIPLSLITASYNAASAADQTAFKQALGIS